jgi:hypothetical protein
MMGGVSPETSWASYKYGIIKCWYIVASCWIFLYEPIIILSFHFLPVFQIMLFQKIFFWNSVHIPHTSLLIRQ